MIDDRFERRDARRRLVMLALCLLALALAIAEEINVLGASGRAWFGFWDANAAGSGRPYVVTIAQPRPGGATAQAGLRDGDRVDLREQPLSTRIAVAYQPMSTQPTVLEVHRGSTTFNAAVTASTVWEGVPVWKLPPGISRPLASFWFAACALLIVARRKIDWNARILAIVLLCMSGVSLDASSVVVPNSAVRIMLLVVSRASSAAAAILLVRLSSGFGTSSGLRKSLEAAAYVAIGLSFAADLAAAVGLTTLWFDPIPFIFRISGRRGSLDVFAWLFVTLCAVAAVYGTPKDQRPKAAWMLLPLPVAMLTSTVVAAFVIVIKSWFANIAVIFASAVILLFSAMIVTYALLKRRVLDFEFVLSRTLVVATVSLIVVASFVLLEWLLGTVLAGVSHATGLIANAALALALGLSLNAIHKRVDVLVDAMLFRKRHEDERALLDFSKEAFYVTETQALLDQAIDKIQRHTDARSAALLLDGARAYSATRSYGDVPLEVGENDGAILALKTWHKPIDPHHYPTAMRGALALPMLVRGRLLGVVVLGERAGGEAYAPDEVEALSQFAQGVGTSLDALSARNDGLAESLERSVAAMSESLATLAKETASLHSDIRRQTL